MTGMKDKLGMMGFISAMMSMGEGDILGMGKKPDNDLNPKDIDTTPKQQPIPKGCKEYMFNKNGGFSTEKMLRDEVVFKCIAASDKSAKKKFNTFITTKTNHPC